MALRTIRTEGDSVLEKICRPVEKIDKRTKDLVGDMLETMYDGMRRWPCSTPGGYPEKNRSDRYWRWSIMSDQSGNSLRHPVRRQVEEGCLSVPGIVRIR